MNDMHILSFDIEEWFLEKYYKKNESWKFKEFEEMLERILYLLEDNSLKATFFCLGGIAKDFPYIVRKIHSNGHEIGCHSFRHKLISKLTPEEFYKDTKESIYELENCIGEKIESYRAPAFSIDEKTKWAFEILAELGVKNDSSVFPSNRDFGGFKSFDFKSGPCKIKIADTFIAEFPIGITKIPLFNKNIGYSGGGYFRLLPLFFIKNKIKNNDYVMCYFHIADLLDIKREMKSKKDYEEYFGEKSSFQKRYIRYLKANIGRKRSWNGLKEIVSDFDFINIKEAALEDKRFPIITI